MSVLYCKQLIEKGFMKRFKKHKVTIVDEKIEHNICFWLHRQSTFPSLRRNYQLCYSGIGISTLVIVAWLSIRKLSMSTSITKLYPRVFNNMYPNEFSRTRPDFFNAHKIVACGHRCARSDGQGGDKSRKLPTSAKNSKVLNDLKMLRDG